MYFDPDPDELKHLEGLAWETAERTLSPSLFGNAVDDVANEALLEYWRLLQGGEPVENPEAMVVTIAKRRAIDAKRRWNIRRHPGLDDHSDVDDLTVIAPSVMIKARQELPPTLTIIDWLKNVVTQAGGDETDVTLTRRTWLEGISTQDAADELGLAEKTVRNRLSATKRAVETLVEQGDAPFLS